MFAGCFTLAHTSTASPSIALYHTLSRPTVTSVEFIRIINQHYVQVYTVGTSDKGPSEIGMTSLQRTLVAAPC